MNQKALYELTITRKLDEVTVPDLSEMIWSRIEEELDKDTGDNTDGNTSSPSSPVGGIIAGTLGLVLVIGFVVNYFNNKKGNLITPREFNNTREPVLIEKPGAPVKQNAAPFSPRIKDNNAVVPMPAMENDTMLNMPELIESLPVMPDTPVADDITGSVPPAIDTAGKKKVRGVQGIGTDGYRIVPKKDSL